MYVLNIYLQRSLFELYSNIYFLIKQLTFKTYSQKHIKKGIEIFHTTVFDNIKKLKQFYHSTEQC